MLTSTHCPCAGELIYLLESHQALFDKVTEAKDVLEHHDRPGPGGDAQGDHAE
jgi:hypothetical protein